MGERAVFRRSYSADPNSAEQNQLTHAKQQLALARQYPGRERSLPTAKVIYKR